MWLPLISDAGTPPMADATPEIVTKYPVSMLCTVPRLIWIVVVPLNVCTQLSVLGVLRVGVIVRRGVMSLKRPPATI